MKRYEKKVTAQKVRAQDVVAELDSEITYADLLDALAVCGYTIEQSKKHNWAGRAYIRTFAELAKNE